MQDGAAASHDRQASLQASCRTAFCFSRETKRRQCAHGYSVKQKSIPKSVLAAASCLRAWRFSAVVLRLSVFSWLSFGCHLVADSRTLVVTWLSFGCRFADIGCHLAVIWLPIRGHWLSLGCHLAADSRTLVVTWLSFGCRFADIGCHLAVIWLPIRGHWLSLG